MSSSPSSSAASRNLFWTLQTAEFPTPPGRPAVAALHQPHLQRGSQYLHAQLKLRRELCIAGFVLRRPFKGVLISDAVHLSPTPTSIYHFRAVRSRFVFTRLRFDLVRLRGCVRCADFSVVSVCKCRPRMQTMGYSWAQLHEGE